MAEVKNDVFTTAIANSASPSFEESYANAAAVPSDAVHEQEFSPVAKEEPLQFVQPPYQPPPLAFQTIPISPSEPKTVPTYTQYTTSLPPSNYDPPQQSPTVPPREPSPPPPRTRACWKLAFWRHFFRVDTNDVLLRVVTALTPIRPPPYLEKKNYSLFSPEAPGAEPQPDQLDAVPLNREPDLYGFVWIGATLWVVMAVVAHVTYAHNCPEGGKTSGRESDCEGGWFGVVGIAFWVIFGYIAVIPTIQWAVLRWKGAPTTLLELLCLYGYAQTPFIAASAICVLPWNAFRWIAVVLAWLWSTLSIVLNLANVWRHCLEQKWALGVAAGVVLCHAGLALSFKLKLFSSLIDLS
eukprot:TRINITY_DN96822_c0_g1_i1.p1 TRINITY_DN96822_c0_g1~~TRINITY_DN96822_c0_g1_i1.p1  ORF type:complete len:360 (-),score=35.52 TRINITY_DN96822_c0_g1_i1:141-1199(-)